MSWDGQSDVADAPSTASGEVGGRHVERWAVTLTEAWPGANGRRGAPSPLSSWRFLRIRCRRDACPRPSLSGNTLGG